MRRKILAHELATLPAELIEELRSAAIQGRTHRLQILAAEVGRYSAEASTSIRTLTRDFDYDALIAELDGISGSGGPGQDGRGLRMSDSEYPAASVLVVDDTLENLRLLSHMLGEKESTFVPSRTGDRRCAPSRMIRPISSCSTR